MAGLVVLCAAYVLSQFFRAFLAVLTPDLNAQLGATSGDLAIASGIWFALFALMQFPVGASLDRFGPRRTASLMLGVFGAGGVALFAIAQSPIMIIVAMGLIGIGCAPVLMASLYIFARTFEPARFAFLTSLFIAIGNLGNIASAAPLSMAVELFSWRVVVGFFAVLTALVAALIFVIVRDPKVDETSGGESGLRGYLTLLAIPALWLIFPAMLVNYSAAAGIRGLWAGPMLTDIHSADASVIGWVTLAMAFAMAIGSLAYGPLDTLFNSRKWVAFTGMAIGTAAMGIIAVNPAMSIGLLTVLFVIIGLTGVGYGVLMAHAKASFPADMMGRGVTLLNFFSIGGAGLMQFLTGRLVTSYNSAGEPLTTYSALMWFYAGVFTLALAIYLFSRDAKPAGNN
ncbi:MAG: MFS transporter [Pseudomonadota bacterium]